MHSLFANGLWTLPASHFFPYGFLVLMVALVSFMVSDLRRAARESAAKKSEATKFVAGYREPNGMSIFFAPEEDPSPAVQPAFARKRRAGK